MQQCSMGGNGYVPRLQPCDGVRCDVARIVTVITADRQLQPATTSSMLTSRYIVFTEGLYY